MSDPAVAPAELDDLEREGHRLEAQLETLVGGRAFALGERLVNLVSPRRPPVPPATVPADLPAATRRQRLRLRNRELARLVELVRAGVRRRVGQALLSAGDGPGAVGLPVRLATLAAAGVGELVERRFDPLWRPIRFREVGRQPVPSFGPGLLRVTVYAELDPSRIDGASVWLASLVEVLAGIEGLAVSVLLAAPLRRPEVLGHLEDDPRVRLLEVEPPPRTGCLSPVRAVRALDALDRREPQDLFLVRGPGVFSGWHLLDALAGRRSLAARSWAYLVDPDAYRTPLRRLRLWRSARAMAGLMCQTEPAHRLLTELLGRATGERIVLLPPMVPAAVERPRPPPCDRPFRLVYAGKFSPPYRLLKVLDAWDELRRRLPGCELHVVGDKIHNQPPVDRFEDRLLQGLSARGVIWHGGLSRADTRAVVASADLALSWRDGSFDGSLELATKVLEYGALGLPVLLNPTPMHRDLLGDDYPAFLDSHADFATAVVDLARSPGEYALAAERCLAAARRFTYPRAAERIQAILPLTG